MSNPGDYNELDAFRGELEAPDGSLRAAPIYVLTTGSYADPDWLASLDWSKLTGTPTPLLSYGALSANNTWTGNNTFEAGVTFDEGFTALGDVTLASAGILNINNGDVSGVGQITGFTSAGVPIRGTTTNGNASAGYVGQIISSLVAAGGAVSLANGTEENVTSISLTAGDWDVEGSIVLDYDTATVTSAIGGLSSTSEILPTDGSEVFSGLQLTTTTAIDAITLPRKRFSLAATTTVYMVCLVDFAAGTADAFGSLTARRVR